jgi:hypothetical protein
VPNNAAFVNLGAKEFLRRYPVSRIDIQGAATAGAGTAADLTPPTKGDEFAGQGSVSKAKRIWNATFSARVDPFAPIASARCPTTVKVQLDHNAGGIPVFYLPYQNDANYRITLDANGPGAANANFFLTELVDGCSVYVEGTRDKPTCYHINASSYAQTHDPTSPQYLNALMNAVAAGSAATLRTMNVQQKHNVQFGFKSGQMDNRFRNDAANRPKTVVAGVNLEPTKKIEERDYMIVSGTVNETAFNATMAALQAAFIVPTNVNGKRVDDMRFVSSQGFIFGIRTGGDWKFYVQRKAMVEYFHRTNAIAAKIDQGLHGTARPLYSLGMQNIVRDVVQYWPTSKLGRDA